MTENPKEAAPQATAGSDPLDSAIRIMLVDDQSLVRTGFRLFLESEPDFVVVAEASDGASAVHLAQKIAPDVIVMDVQMPEMDGIEATRRIVETNPKSRVIILTTFDLDEYAFAGLRAGASGFLVKNVRPAELIAAIRAVANGDASVSPRVTRQLIELFSQKFPETAGARENAAPVESARVATLTKREHTILIAMAQGLTNAEIAQRFTLAESTVKTHVGHVLMKLDLRDRVQAVILAYELAIVEPGSGGGGG